MPQGLSSNSTAGFNFFFFFLRRSQCVTLQRFHPAWKQTDASLLSTSSQITQQLFAKGLLCLGRVSMVTRLNFWSDVHAWARARTHLPHHFPSSFPWFWHYITNRVETSLTSRRISFLRNCCHLVGELGNYKTFSTVLPKCVYVVYINHLKSRKCNVGTQWLWNNCSHFRVFIWFLWVSTSGKCWFLQFVQTRRDHHHHHLLNADFHSRSQAQMVCTLSQSFVLCQLVSPAVV